MLRRTALTAALAVLAAAFALTAAASAQSPLIDAARLEGAYTMNGVITTAVGVPGERAGQTVQRQWTFTPQCGAGACTSILLSRQRQSGSDQITLTRAGSGYYTGTGTFTAPVRCHGRTYRRGAVVPFTITVQITGAEQIGSLVQAIQVRATYRNRARLNLTRCVPTPSYDSATYAGAPVSV